MIVYGMRHYGPVDRIENVGVVKTRFIHIWFVPLVPLGSTFIVKETDDGVQGVGVGLNFRSVLVAWSRTAALIGGFGAMSVGALGAMGILIDGSKTGQKLMKKGAKAVSNAEAMDMASNIGMAVGGFVGLLFCILLFWGIGRMFRDAKGARKAELMGKLGIAPGVDDPVMD
jgi:hypothetical protein